MKRAIFCLAAVLTAPVSGAAAPKIAEPPACRVAGTANAKTVIYEFTDFQCPGCSLAAKELSELLAAHKGKIRLVYKYYPLELIHKWAVPAALGAECAGKQGKFWAYADLVYANQETWTKYPYPPRVFEEYAQKLGLDVAAYQRCLRDPATEKAVRKDMAEGDALPVNATPTFFVNGVKFEGLKSFREEMAKRFPAPAKSAVPGKPASGKKQ